jgi:hypothetical protein
MSPIGLTRSIGIGSYIGLITCNVKSDSDIIGIWDYWKCIKSQSENIHGEDSPVEQDPTSPISIGVYWKYCFWSLNIPNEFKEEDLDLEKLELFPKLKDKIIV